MQGPILGTHIRKRTHTQETCTNVTLQHPETPHVHTETHAMDTATKRPNSNSKKHTPIHRDTARHAMLHTGAQLRNTRVHTQVTKFTLQHTQAHTHRHTHTSTETQPDVPSVTHRHTFRTSHTHTHTHTDTEADHSKQANAHKG